MPKQQSSLNDDLFRLLKVRGYDPVPYSSEGKVVPVPSEAEVFQFHFVKDGTDFGPVTVSIDGANDLKVYYNSRVATSPKDDETEHEDSGLSWYQLLKQLKLFAKNRQMGFDLEDQDNLKYDMAKRQHIKKLDEGYYAMGKTSSYNDSIPAVKMIIRHTRAVQEGEQRYRNIAKIFVENAAGERFLLPTTKPGIGRVYARHVAEGGTPYDDRGQHITSLVEEYTKMAGFVRATRNNQFNESTQELVSEGINHYNSLRETLHKLSGKKGYANYFESWTPTITEEANDDSLKDMFVSTKLDPRIECVMPILAKLKKNVPAMAEADAFESWANKVVDETLLPSSPAEYEELEDLVTSDLPVGPDASNAKHKLSSVVSDDELDDDLEDLAATDPDADATETIRAWLMKQSKPELKNIASKLAAAKSENEMAEGLDANQKRVGQLGPTEKVKNNNVGKLVGACESVEQEVVEGSEERKQNATWAQITDYEKRAKATKNDMKKAHYEKMASDLRGKLKTKDDIKEGQEDLDAILRIVRK